MSHNEICPKVFGFFLLEMAVRLMMTQKVHCLAQSLVLNKHSVRVSGMKWVREWVSVSFACLPDILAELPMQGRLRWLTQPNCFNWVMISSWLFTGKSPEKDSQSSINTNYSSGGWLTSASATLEVRGVWNLGRIKLRGESPKDHRRTFFRWKWGVRWEGE